MGRDELSLYVSRNDAPSDGEVDAPSWSWNCQAWWAAKFDKYNSKQIQNKFAHCCNRSQKFCNIFWYFETHNWHWQDTQTTSTQKQACDGQEGTSMVGDTKAPSAAEGHMEWRQTCWLKKVWWHKKSPKLFLTGDRTQWHCVSSAQPKVLLTEWHFVSSVLPSVQCPPTQWHCSCDRSSWNEEGGATSSVTAPRCQTHWVGQQTWLLILTIKQDLNIAKWAKQSIENDTRPTRAAKRQKMFSDLSSGLLSKRSLHLRITKIYKKL